jgi:hypothetical protein
MPGLEPQENPYGLAPTTDTMSAPANESEALPMPDATPADLAINDGQPAPSLAGQQRHRAAAARGLAALDAAVAQMDRDRAPPARSGRAALDHIDAPDLYAHHIETGKSAVRLQARLAGQPDAQAEAAANDYQSAIHLAHVDARATDDAIGALVAIRRHGADMRPDDRRKALAGIAPRFADERAIADVEAGDLAAAPFAPLVPKMAPADLRDRMLAISPDEQQAMLPTLLQRYKGDAARSWAAAALGPDKLDALIARHGDGWYPALPDAERLDVAQHMALLGARGSKRALPADPAAAAMRIVNQPGVGDERRQKALDELNWRMMQADRTRQAASADAAAEADALANELGDAFTSIAQIPPAVRRELSKEASDRLVVRATRNIHRQSLEGIGNLPLSISGNDIAGPNVESRRGPGDDQPSGSTSVEAVPSAIGPSVDTLTSAEREDQMAAATSSDTRAAVAGLRAAAAPSNRDLGDEPDQRPNRFSPASYFSSTDPRVGNTFQASPSGEGVDLSDAEPHFTTAAWTAEEGARDPFSGELTSGDDDPTLARSSIAAGDGGAPRTIHQDMRPSPALWRWLRTPAGGDQYVIDSPPDFITRFRRAVPDFLRREKAVFAASKSTEPPLEHALLVYQSLHDRHTFTTRTVMAKDQNGLVFQDFATGHQLPFGRLPQLKGFRLIIAEHTHPLPWYDPFRTTTARQGPTNLDVAMSKFYPDVHFVINAVHTNDFLDGSNDESYYFGRGVRSGARY